MGAQWKHRIRQASGAAKGKVFSKLAKEIVVAAKAGGADPTMNAKLRALVESADSQHPSLDLKQIVTG